MPINNTLEQYKTISKTYDQAFDEWNRFFSATDITKEKDRYIFDEHIHKTRKSISKLFSSIEDKRREIGLELVKLFLSDPGIDISSQLDENEIQWLEYIIDEKFNNNKIGEQLIYLIKSERSKLDNNFLNHHILSTATDHSGNPVSLFQLDKKGKKIFAPYIMLQGQKYSFSTSPDNLDHISSKIYLYRGDIKMSLEYFMRKSGHKIKETDHDLVDYWTQVPDFQAVEKIWEIDKTGLSYTWLFIDDKVLKNFLWFDLFKSIFHVNNNIYKKGFWSYVLIWLMIHGYMDKYYFFDKKQKNILYILQTFYKDKYEDLWILFDNIIWDKIAHLDEVIDKSRDLDNVLIFLFETIIAYIISHQNNLLIYKTLPHNDIHDKIDLVINDRFNTINPIQFVDLKSYNKSRTNHIKENGHQSLWSDLTVFLKNKLDYDLFKSIKDVNNVPIRQVALGDSKENYYQAMIYIRALMDVIDEDKIDKTSPIRHIERIEKDIISRFLQGYSWWDPRESKIRKKRYNIV